MNLVFNGFMSNGSSRGSGGSSGSSGRRSPPAGSLSARPTNTGGATGGSSLGGSTGVPSGGGGAAPVTPAVSKQQQREAILSKPTAVQKLGGSGGSQAVPIQFQTTQGKTQVLVEAKPQPVVVLSPKFAAKAASSVQGGVVVEKTKVFTRQDDGTFRAVQDQVGVARLPIQEVPKKSPFPLPQANTTNPFAPNYQPPTKQLFPVGEVQEVPKVQDVGKFERAKARFKSDFGLPLTDREKQIISGDVERFAGSFAGSSPQAMRLREEERQKPVSQKFKEQVERLFVPSDVPAIRQRQVVAGFLLLGSGKLLQTGTQLTLAGLETTGAVVQSAPLVRQTVAQVTKRVAPQVAKGEAGGVASGFARFVKGFATPQAVGEVLVGQELTRQGVKQIERTSGADIVKASQESSALLFESRGKDLYVRNEQGVPIAVKEQDKSLVSQDSAGKYVTDLLKYDFVANLPYGQQVLRKVSPTFAAEEERAIRDVGRSRGLSGKELDTFVGNVRSAGNRLQTVEALATLFTVERTTERLGKKTIGEAFLKREGVEISKKDIAKRLFTITAPKFAVAGAVEGSAQYGVQLKTRGGEFEPLDLAKSAAGGAVISTLLGGGAVAFSATRPRLSKVFSFTGQALEFPYELGGDVIAAGQTRIVKGLGGEVIEPAIKPKFAKGVRSVSSEAANAFELLAEGRRTGVKPRVTTLSFGVQSNANVQSNVKSASQSVAKSLSTGTPTTTPVKTKGRIATPSVTVPTPIKTPTPTPTPTPTTTPTTTPTPSETPVPVPVPVNVNTPVSVPVNIPINTNVFGLRGFVPPPLPFPSEGGSGTGRGGGKVFRNELLAAQDLFRQQVRFGLKNLGQKVGKPTKKKKQVTLGGVTYDLKKAKVNRGNKTASALSGMFGGRR